MARELVQAVKAALSNSATTRNRCARTAKSPFGSRSPRSHLASVPWSTPVGNDMWGYRTLTVRLKSGEPPGAHDPTPGPMPLMVSPRAAWCEHFRPSPAAAAPVRGGRQ